MIDISVIVTVYNLEKYIGECLDSIIKQTGVEFEIVCVDDASTDGSLSVLKEYEEKDSRIKVIRLSENKGLASARNAGYRYAQGEYLYNIDGDDLLMEGALLRMYTCAKENDLDLLGFAAKSFFDEEELRRFGDEKEYVRKYEYPGVYKGIELFATLMKNGDRATSNRVLYCCKRSFFLENDLFDVEGLRYCDDSMFPFYLKANRVMCIPDELYLRRYRQGSAVTSPMKKIYLECMVVLFCAEMKKWMEIEATEEVNRQIAVYFDWRLGEINSLQAKFSKDKTRETYLIEHPAVNYFYRRFIRQEPRCVDCLSTDQLNRIRKAKTVILYGAGYMATEVSKVLDFCSIINYEIAVTRKENKEAFFRGKQIKCISEFAGIEGALVIVAMAEKNKKDIMPILEANGLQDVIWIAIEN